MPNGTEREKEPSAHEEFRNLWKTDPDLTATAETPFRSKSLSTVDAEVNYVGGMFFRLVRNGSPIARISTSFTTEMGGSGIRKIRINNHKHEGRKTSHKPEDTFYTLLIFLEEKAQCSRGAIITMFVNKDTEFKSPYIKKVLTKMGYNKGEDEPDGVLFSKKIEKKIEENLD